MVKVYKYAHDFPGTLCPGVFGSDKQYYQPTEQGVEKKIKDRLDKWRELKGKPQ